MPKEEERFRWMIEIHGRAFAFSPREIGCINPNHGEANGDFHNISHTMEHQADQVSRAHIPKLIEPGKEKIEMESSNRPVYHSPTDGLLCQKRTVAYGSFRTCNLSMK